MVAKNTILYGIAFRTYSSSLVLGMTMSQNNDELLIALIGDSQIHASRDHAMLGCAIVLLCLSWIAVSLRVYVRGFMVKNSPSQPPALTTEADGYTRSRPLVGTTGSC